jgi:hypothetical protein
MQPNEVQTGRGRHHTCLVLRFAVSVEDRQIDE